MRERWERQGIVLGVPGREEFQGGGSAFHDSGGGL